MPVRLKNNARALLAVSISEIDPFIRVRVGKGERFPQLGLNDWFPLALEDDQGNVEITRAVARAGDVLTVVRGQEGTTARAFSAGALVSLRLTAEASRAFLTGEDDPDDDDQDGDADPELTAPRGLIFNGLIVNAYHDEVGRQGYFHPYSGTSEGQYVFAGACYQAAQVISDYLEEIGTPGALAVTGSLPDAGVGEAYEGRLQIVNAIGACTVRQTGGAELPSGATIRVDQATMEVVVAWPAPAPAPIELVNPGFEDLDLTGWTVTRYGETGEPAAASVTTQRPYEGIASGLWTGERGAGHAGGVEAVWENGTMAPVLLGQPVSASMQIALKDTSSSQNRGRVRLNFYDAGENLVRVELGTLIRGNDSSYRQSKVERSAPVDGFASLGVWTTANDSDNSGVLIDAAQWNVPESTGTEEEATYCIDLIVTDSAGREAPWSGCIDSLISAYSVEMWTGVGGTSQVVPVATNLSSGGLVIQKNKGGSATYFDYSTDGTTVRRLTGQSTGSVAASPVVMGDGQITTDLCTSANNFKAYCIRKRPGVMDVVRYTGTGADQSVPHALGKVPGVVIIRRENSGSAWAVYVKALGPDVIGSFSGYSNNTTAWNGDPTATHLNLKTHNNVNVAGGQYVAFVFPDDGDIRQAVVAVASETNMNLPFRPMFVFTALSSGDLRIVDEVDWPFLTTRQAGWNVTNTNAENLDSNFSTSLSPRTDSWDVSGAAGGSSAPVYGGNGTAWMLMFRDKRPVPELPGLNPRDLNGHVLSNNNATATRTGGSIGSIRGATFRDTGKWYFEVSLDSMTGTSHAVGVASMYDSLTSGGNNGSMIYYADGRKRGDGGGGYTSFGSSITTGHVVGIAYDADTGQVWFARNNVWQGSGNPAAGTTPALTTDNPLVKFPLITLQNGGVATLKDTAASLTYAPPTGFQPWAGE